MSRNNLTFRGGVDLKGLKELTHGKPIEKAAEPKTVYIALHQHVGAPCKALVKRNDEVKVGQKIGESDTHLTSPVHSSVSGVVKRIDKIYTPDGYRVDCVEIESDGLNELHESIKTRENPESLSKEEIIDIIKEAGIVGLGGASFPTHAKMIASEEAGIDSVILNGAECEPYLTCDHRTMLERSDLMVYGMEVLMRYFEAEKGYIGIENNKMDAIEKLDEVLSDKDKLKTANLKTTFPQGDSYRMIDAILGRTVPQGGRCKDVGVIVNNVGTSVAIAEAILEGKPLYERVVTVSGDCIKEPKNLLVKIGTTVGDILEQCGGFTKKPGKIIAGGPMTGYTQFSLDTPIIKGTTGIVVLSEEATRPEKVSPCIKCGKCIEVCPVNLEPLYISINALKDRFEVAEQLSALACIECGSCSYICPSKRPLTESIVYAQKEIKANRKKS